MSQYLRIFNERSDMRKFCKCFLFFLVLTVLTGCTVGRFVTNVSLDGSDSLAVEKCTTKKFEMYFWNTECSSSTIKALQSQ
jgi:hypothetical protein